MNPVGVTVGIVVAIVGLWLVIAAFKPRPRRYVRVDSASSIWMRPVDVARKSTHVARQQAPGSAISSRSTRKKLTVSVEDDGSAQALQQRVTTALENEFAPLHVRPRIAVALRPQQDAGQEDQQ